MLFFRSEEHLHNWSKFDSDTQGGIISLSDLVNLFSNDYFKNRMDLDYVSHIREYEVGFVNGLNALEKAGSFWKLQ